MQDISHLHGRDVRGIKGILESRIHGGDGSNSLIERTVLSSRTGSQCGSDGIQEILLYLVRWEAQRFDFCYSRRRRSWCSR